MRGILGRYCTLATKPLLGSATVGPPSKIEQLRHQCSNRYYLSFEVAKGSFLIGSTVAQAGLISQPGVILVDTDFEMDKKMEAGNFLHFAATAAGVAPRRIPSFKCMHGHVYMVAACVLVLHPVECASAKAMLDVVCRTGEGSPPHLGESE